MPELPEVEYAARQVRAAVVGRTVRNLKALHPSQRRRLSARDCARVRGATIETVDRHGKHQLLRLSTGDVVVFVSAGDRPGLYRTNLRGERTVQIVDGAFSMPDITPNGRSVVFVAHEGGMQSIWSAPVAGGAAQPVVRRPAVNPHVSHDGRRLLYQSLKRTLVVCDLPACSNSREFALPAGQFVATKDGTRTRQQKIGNSFSLVLSRHRAISDR